MNGKEEELPAGCIFCRISAGELPSEKVIENDEFFAIRDINPKAPVHVLVIPRQHIRSLNEVGVADESFGQRLLAFTVSVAEELGVKKSGYRVITNVEAGGGQVVFHLHSHLLAGRSVGFDMEEEL